jgi:sec-independent protein translocase protein TatA
MAVFGLPGGMEWLVILGIVLLLFGPSQLPKLANTFGKSARALKDGIEGKLADDDEDETKEPVKAEKSEKSDEGTSA